MKTLVAVSVIAGFVLGLAGTAPAANPTQSDFEACNRAAQAGSGASAAPSSGRTGPAVTSPSGTPDTTSGVQSGGTGGKTGPMITGSGRTPGSTGGVAGGTGAISTDEGSARGMSPEGMKDPAFKTAYTDCMKQRGF